MLELLQDIATDPNRAIGPDNPLRQVIINTHSPTVVQQVPDDSLLVAENQEAIQDGNRYKQVRFSSLSDTCRSKDAEGVSTVSKGELLAYLNPVIRDEAGHAAAAGVSNGSRKSSQPIRVVDREDLQPLLPFLGKAE